MANFAKFAGSHSIKPYPLTVNENFPKTTSLYLEKSNTFIEALYSIAKTACKTIMLYLFYKSYSIS
jgi:hypothetical protein